MNRVRVGLGGTWQAYTGARRGVQVGTLNRRSVRRVEARRYWSDPRYQRRMKLEKPKKADKGKKSKKDLGAEDDSSWWETAAKTAASTAATVVAPFTTYAAQAGSAAASALRDDVEFSEVPPATGYYREGRYAYHWLATTGAIRIVSSPRSTQQQVVAKGSTAYTAILKAIESGQAKPISAAQLKAMRSTARSEVAATDAAPEEDLSTGAGDVIYEWGPWVAGGFVVVVAGVLLLRIGKNRRRRPAAATGGA